MQREPRQHPWWIDLLHPLPLGAAVLLFLNDHALKGAHLLPGWLTGKLSDFAFAALACVATSKKAEPPPMMPRAVAQQWRQKGCAKITPVACRVDAERFVLRLSAMKYDSRSCRVNVGSFRSGGPNSRYGRLTEAQAFEVTGPDAVLFGAFGRLAKDANTLDQTFVRVAMQGLDEEGPIRLDKEMPIACRPGFGEDTQPPAEVAK